MITTTHCAFRQAQARLSAALAAECCSCCRRSPSRSPTPSLRRRASRASPLSPGRSSIPASRGRR